MGVGILTWIFLPRFPDQMKDGKHWLFNKDEIALAAERSSSKSPLSLLERTQLKHSGYNTLGAKLELKQIWVTLKDPKSWAFAMINGGIALGISSVGVFLPSFIKSFGYSPGTSHPPYHQQST